MAPPTFHIFRVRTLVSHVSCKLNMHALKCHETKIQLNLSNTDTEGKEQSVRIREVSVLHHHEYDDTLNVLLTIRNLDDKWSINVDNLIPWTNATFIVWTAGQLILTLIIQ